MMFSRHGIRHSFSDHENMRANSKGKRNCKNCGKLMKRKYKKYCVWCEKDLKAQKRDQKRLKRDWDNTAREMVRDFGKKP